MQEKDGHSFEVVDAQIHMWQIEDAEHPWSSDWREWAQRGGLSPTVEELIAEMDAAAVDHVVLVAPPVGGLANNDVIADAVSRFPDRFTGMGLVDLTKPDPELVASWKSTQPLRGIRVSFRVGAARNWLTDGTADWLWPAVEAAELPIMVFCPGQVDVFDRVLEEHPHLHVAIDHVAITGGPKPSIDSYIDDIAILAHFPGVTVKASALPSLLQEEFPFPSAQRATRRLIEIFGAERVFWGTDMTRGMPCTYRQAATYLSESGALDLDELQLVMGAGLRRWFDQT